MRPTFSFKNEIGKDKIGQSRGRIEQKKIEKIEKKISLSTSYNKGNKLFYEPFVSGTYMYQKRLNGRHCSGLNIVELLFKVIMPGYASSSSMSVVFDI